MSISLNNKFFRIKHYIRKQGWIEDAVILEIIVSNLGKQKNYEELEDLIENYESVKCRNYFYKLKKFVTNNKGYIDLLKLENVWQAFDSAMANLKQ